MSLVDAALLQAQLPSGGKEYGVKHLWEWGTSLATRPGSYWRGDALVGTGFGFAFCISGHNENIWQKSYTQASLRKIVCNSCGFFLSMLLLFSTVTYSSSTSWYHLAKAFWRNSPSPTNPARFGGNKCVVILQFCVARSIHFLCAHDTSPI